MKFILLCLAVLLAVGADAKRCNSQEDCGEGECCIAKSLFGLIKGECTKLAVEGESCSDPDDKMTLRGDKYALFCPCTEGLSCEPTEVKDLPFIGTIKIDERCVAGATTAPPEEVTTVEEEVTTVEGEEEVGE